MDPTEFIPGKLKERVADGLINFLARQAERLGQKPVAEQLRQLTSQGDFYQAVQQSLEKGFYRFQQEYVLEDEDLVAAITTDERFWQYEDVQTALVEMISRPGASLEQERETLVQGFSSVLPDRINRQRVDKAVTHLLRSIVEELWTLPGAKEIRDVYNLQFHRITAEAVREQSAIARQQLEVTTQLSLGMQQALLQLTGAIEQNLLTAPSTATTLPAPKPYHNLPQPTYVRFVGRERELAWLHDRLSPADRAWQIALTGIGGVGKSTLALAIAHEYLYRYHELPAEERFEAIIWVSAKEEVLTAYRREQADLSEKVLRTLEDVYTTIAQTLERQDITRARPEEQSPLVEIALRHQRTLLIMDNLESVQDDRIKPFLRHLPAPTKAIITSREWLDVADVLPLLGLSTSEADTLIAEEADQRNVLLTLEQRQRIIDLTSGLPLPIKLGVARMASGESAESVFRWLGNAAGDLPAYCIQGQVELAKKRDPNSWLILLSCSLFERTAGVSKEALGIISNLSLSDRDNALTQMQRLYLINETHSGRFWVFPIIQRFAKNQFSISKSTEDIIENWLAWHRDFVEKHGKIVYEDRTHMQKFSQEFPNIHIAILWCNERQRWDDLIVLCEGTWRFIYFSGLLFELDEVLQIWLRALQRTGSNQQQEGIVYLQYARLYGIWRQREKTIEYLDMAEPILTKYGNYAELAEAWATRSQIHIGFDEFHTARNYAEKIFELGNKIGNKSIIVMSHLRFIDIESRLGEYDKAMEWLIKSEPLVNNIKTVSELTAFLYRKARLLQMMGKYEEAELSLIDALHENIELGARRYTAFNKYRLAQIYQVTGRNQGARQLAEEAADLFDRLGIQDYADQVEVFIKGL